MNFPFVPSCTQRSMSVKKLSEFPFWFVCTCMVCVCVCSCVGDWQVSGYPGPLRQLWGQHCRLLGLIEGWLENIRGENGGEGDTAVAGNYYYPQCSVQRGLTHLWPPAVFSGVDHWVYGSITHPWTNLSHRSWRSRERRPYLGNGYCDRARTTRGRLLWFYKGLKSTIVSLLLLL